MLTKEQARTLVDILNIYFYDGELTLAKEQNPELYEAMEALIKIAEGEE
jgi:hypothetical protein